MKKANRWNQDTNFKKIAFTKWIVLCHQKVRIRLELIKWVRWIYSRIWVWVPKGLNLIIFIAAMLTNNPQVNPLLKVQWFTNTISILPRKALVSRRTLEPFLRRLVSHKSYIWHQLSSKPSILKQPNLIQFNTHQTLMLGGSNH